MVRFPFRSPFTLRGLPRCVAGLFLACSLASLGSGEGLVSGLQVGEYADQFLVKDCTGPAAGKTLCYYCRYAERPVVALFVRDLSDEVGRFVQQIDRCVAEHQGDRLAAFVVFVGKDTPAAEARLKRLAKHHALLHTPLTICREDPQQLKTVYRLHPDAAVTALVWQRGRVTVNRAYADAQVTADDRRTFLAAIETSLKP